MAGDAEDRSRWLGAAVLSYGFRTFFLLGAIAAIALMTVSVAVLLGWNWPGTVPAHLWHGHEMLFGFVAAAIAGFLLTAVPNWTGATAIAGSSLLALAILWFAGRIASLPIFATSIIAAVIDIAFPNARNDAGPIPHQCRQAPERYVPGAPFCASWPLAFFLRSTPQL